MDSDTESAGSAGRRSHHSLEDALEIDLAPVGEVGPEIDDGVSVACGQDGLVSLEEPVFEVPELRDTSPQIRAHTVVNSGSSSRAALSRMSQATGRLPDRFQICVFPQ